MRHRRVAALVAARAAALVSVAALVHNASATDEGVALTGDDFVVSATVKIKPGVYHVVDANGDGVIHVRGREATLDLTGVTLVGHAKDAAIDPDGFVGIGIDVESPHAIIVGGAVRGFKVGVRVRNSEGSEVKRLDASGNYRQRLHSTIDREDERDWLFGHENDDGQWERDYGAGIACSDSPGVTVRDCVVRGGQNGLLLQRCDGARVYDNDFSFNSGWGVALWRTSKAVVSHNSLDWCVRGYSHGRYARGQDSAGILVFEQCSDNVFAVNSATHGGDGFFLYAGNETLKKTGKGGCNGNVLWRNDFSHAVANGIEATFSEGNRFVDNDINDCDHAVWAGYSWDTNVVENRIADCAHGVSIEHGHGNGIWENSIARCGVGVHLWTDDDPDLAKSVWGAGRDTTSRGNEIVLNGFASNRVDVRLDRDRDSNVGDNQVSGALRLELTEGTPPPREKGAKNGGGVRNTAESLGVLGARDVYLPAATLRGRKYILIDEWGPVPPRETRLFPARQSAAGEAKLSVLGVDGTFEVKALTDGFIAEPSKGALPATVSIRRKDGVAGAAAFDVEIVAKGTTHRASGSLFTTTWDVRFFTWTKDPREDADAWKALLAGEPVERRTLPALDFAWQDGKVSDAVGADRFATSATTEVELPAGQWTLHTVSDDGIRVWFDDRLVIDDWTHHGPTPHDVALDFAVAAKHTIRVEHFEIDGWAALSVGLLPVAGRGR
ncbi:MAG: right-handed parallel beta-helix repeat-containing protein [Planctomycetes bacterium]|nr:right-handed parallel beta-helix repeat-containing protein [Planctomycetota bacterium]